MHIVMVPLNIYFSHVRNGKGSNTVVWMNYMYYHSIKGMGTTKENPQIFQNPTVWIT